MLNSSIYSPDEPTLTYQDSYFAFPAHGYTKKDVLLAKSLRAFPIDCTCPILIVNKNMMKNNIKSGFKVFLLGKTDHPEVLSILDNIPEVEFIPIEKMKEYDYSSFLKYPKIAIYPQSTVGMKDYSDFLNLASPYIKGKFIKGDICNECKKRWNLLKKLKPISKSTIIVVGDKDSSNANEFLNIGIEEHPDCLSFLAEIPSDLDSHLDKIDFTRDIYVFSSTSASLKGVKRIVKALKKKLFLFILRHPFKYMKRPAQSVSDSKSSSFEE